MRKAVQTIDVRFRLTPNDVARLDEQCTRFEMPRAELLRYYIRQGYDSMGETIKTDQATQQQLFPVTMPGGAHTTSPPLPKKPRKEDR
jgi:3-methyladenine DNA glycosylase AlkC